MKFDLEESITILERTPKVLTALLLGLSKDWTHKNEGENTWSPYDVLGHLIHGEETDWMQRTKVILEKGVSQAFEPFDRFAQFEKSKGKTLEELLLTFTELRNTNLKKLKDLNLSESDFDKKGIHPTFGEVTLRELLSTWTVHDLGHIVQISRVIAKQYGDEVGPWKEFLNVVQ